MHKIQLLIALVLTFMVFQLNPTSSKSLTSNIEAARLIRTFTNQSSMNIDSFPNFQGNKVKLLQFLEDKLSIACVANYKSSKHKQCITTYGSEPYIILNNKIKLSIAKVGNCAVSTLIYPPNPRCVVIVDVNGSSEPNRQFQESHLNSKKVFDKFRFTLTNKGFKPSFDTQKFLKKYAVTVRKPAIYLYPETPTIVNIKLADSILIDTNIPRHVKNKGWKVLAQSNGLLNDYQVEYTNCDDFNDDNFGLEYAKKACLTNNYPYIYWDGLQLSKSIPTSKRGWIIKKSDIQDFLSEKLESLKFNQKERYDFLKYWGSTLTNSSAKSYFIYFIQNEAVDKYLPMKVSPRPDSSNRLYMVAKEFKTEIALKVKPQKLKPIKRKGFTIIEWGGILIKQ